MEESLKKYIQENRESFDVFEAPDVWPAISAALSTASLIKSVKILKMIKISLGASLVAVTTATLIELVPAHKQDLHVASKSASVQRTVLDSHPSVINLKLPLAESPSVIPSQTRAANFAPRISDNEAQPPGEQNTLPLREDTLPQMTGLLSADTLFKNVRRLEVELNFCNVNIVGHAKNGLAMRAKMDENAEMIVCGTKAYRRSRTVLRYRQEKDVLKVWMESERLQENEKVSIRSSSGSFIDFEVPDGIELQIRDHSGNISLSDAETKNSDLRTDFGSLRVNAVSGELRLAASSGHIRCVEIKGNVSSKTDFGNEFYDGVTGNLHSNASSGHVTVNNLRGNAEVTTSFGNQKFMDVKGDIKATASSGGIRIMNAKGNVISVTAFGTQHFEDVEGDIHADARSGNIVVQRSKGTLTLSTSFGSIKGTEVTLVSKSDLKASSGNIHIDFANELDELKFDLRSSSGTVSVGDAPKQSLSNKTLQLGSGSILVYGSTTFGNQTYR